jgi:diguanylate cyclase (GGDEF)-like protein
MENNSPFLHSFLTFLVSLFVIKTLWKYRFFHSARFFFTFIGLAGALCLGTVMLRTFPDQAVRAQLFHLYQWGQLALPVAAGIFLFEMYRSMYVRSNETTAKSGLLSMLLFILPTAIMLLPIPSQNVVVVMWALCLLFASYHLFPVLGAKARPTSPRRVILGISAVLPVVTSLLHAFSPPETIDVTPAAAVLFAGVVSAVMLDEQNRFARLTMTKAGNDPEQRSAAWFILTRAGQILNLDSLSLGFLGFELSQVIGRPVKSLFPAADCVLEALEADPANALVVRSDIFRPGGLCQFSLHASPLPDPVFPLHLMKVSAVEEVFLPADTLMVPESFYAELKKGTALLEIALEATAHGVMITDLSGNLLLRNRYLLRLLDLPDHALKPDDQDWQQVLSRRVQNPQRFFNLLEQIQIQKTIETLDIFELNNGRLLECQTRFYHSEELESSFHLWCLTDCTEQQRRENELRHLSMHDPLTGIYNRAFFDARFIHFRLNALYPVSMIMIDVDGLKKINDDMGHPAGDELLRQTGKILRQACRTEDVVARLGGDEFAVLLPCADALVAEQVLMRIHGLLNLYNIRHPQEVISLSMGYAVAETQRELANLVIRADDTMYENRRQQREGRKV